MWLFITLYQETMCVCTIHHSLPPGSHLARLFAKRTSKSEMPVFRKFPDFRKIFSDKSIAFSGNLQPFQDLLTTLTGISDKLHVASEIVHTKTKSVCTRLQAVSACVLMSLP